MARRFAALAKQIVLRDAITKPKDNQKRKKAHEKIRKLVEFDERKKHVSDFLVMWNRWRDFYFQLPPVDVKTPGQVTTIENAIDFAKENNMDLNLLIACVHRAYSKRLKLKPGFSEIISRGIEHWQLYDDVIADIEKEEFERKSL